MSDQITLALDASTKCVGFSLWSGYDYLSGFERKYKGQAYLRMDRIARDVLDLCQEHLVQHVAIEKPVYVQGHGHDTHFELACAFGAIASRVAGAGLHVYEINPKSAKAALVSGKATKAQMIQAAQLYVGARMVVGEHHADSIGVFLAWWNSHGHRLQVESMRA